ncbi:hypothetical protein AB0H34_44200, partial [Saccharopolyspora shandongensis]
MLSVMPDLRTVARDSAEVLLRAFARDLLQQSREAGHNNPAETTRLEVDRAWQVEWSGDDELAAQGIVQRTHDHRKLLGDADLSLDEVVALVAAKYHELGRGQRDKVEAYSRALADRLGTRGTGLRIHAGAGPEPAGGLPRSADVDTTTGRSDNPDSPERNDVPGSETTEAAADDPAIDDTESVVDETVMEEFFGQAELRDLRARLERLREDGEPPGGPMPTAEVQQPQAPADGASEISQERESDSDGMGSVGFDAVAERSDRPEDVEESRVDDASSSTDVDRAEQARGVVEYYAGIAGGRAELADAIGLHHQERGFGWFGSRWVRNYEQRLVDIAKLTLDVFGSVTPGNMPATWYLRNVRRSFDAVRRHYPGVGERVTVDHLRQIVRDFNPADERPVTDADVQKLVMLVQTAKDRWREVTFETLRRVWGDETAPVEIPGLVAERALESIVSRLRANRRLMANREGLRARVDALWDNVLEQRETPWRPTDRSRAETLGDLRVTGEWMIHEARADTSDPAEAALVALAQEHGGGRAVAEAVGVASRDEPGNRLHVSDVVQRDWERLTDIARSAVARHGDLPTLDQLRQAADDIDQLWPYFQMLRMQGADNRLGLMPADLDEAGLAEYLRSVVQLWAERLRPEDRFGGAAARAVTDDDVRHLADLMVSQAREGAVTWESLERAWNSELDAVADRGESELAELRAVVARMMEEFAPFPSWYRQDLRELADQMAWFAGAQVAWRPADALVVDRLEQLHTRASALAEEVMEAREALMLADGLVLRFGRDALGVDGHGELSAADRRRIVRFGALAAVLADVRIAEDLDVAHVRHARQVARALTEVIPGLAETGVMPGSLRGIVRDFLGLPAGAWVSNEDIQSLADVLVAVPSGPEMLREVGSRWVSERLNSVLSGLWSAYDRIAAHLAELPGDYHPELRAAVAEAAPYRGPSNVRWAPEDGRHVHQLEALRSGLESLARDVSLGDPDANSPLTTVSRAVESTELLSEAPRVSADRTDDSGSGSSAQAAAFDLHALAGAFQSVLQQDPRAVPAGSAASGRPPVREQSLALDLQGEIDRARQVGWSREEDDAARGIVHGTHDIALARGDAALSLDDVVALVAARYHELGRDQWDKVVEFSRALADRLGTRGSGLGIRAGAGPEESGGPGLGPIEARLEALEASVARLAARRVQKLREERDLRVVRLRGALEQLQARQAELKALTAWKWVLQVDRDALPEDLGGLRNEWEGLPTRIEKVQAELAEIGREQAREGGSTEVVRPDVVVEFARLVGRAEEHLAALPEDFRPDVRAQVAALREVAEWERWTPEELHSLDSKLEQVRQAEEYLRNVRSSEEIPAGMMASSVLDDHTVRRSGESAAAAELSVRVSNANAGLERMRQQGLRVDDAIADVQARIGDFGIYDGLRNVVAHHILSQLVDPNGESVTELLQKLDELTFLRDWDERHERAAARLRGWRETAGPDVARLLADADGILGPLKVSERFRDVLAHWLGEHPGDWRGAQAVRVELADYLGRDADIAIGVAVSGLAPGVFERAKAHEEFYSQSSLKQEVAVAGEALRQLAVDRVDRLYASAKKVLGPLYESKPFRDVMAHALMTRDDQQLQQLMENPRADQQVQELRWKLVRYLAGDLSGGADSTAADELLFATVATVAPEPGDNVSTGNQIYLRRVAVGEALSGLPGKIAVENMLRNEAIEELLRGDYASGKLGDEFRRGATWDAKIRLFVKNKLISDLKAAGDSLRQILADVEASAELRKEYDDHIAGWLKIDDGTYLTTIRGRVAEADDALQRLRGRLRNDAIRKKKEIFEAADRQRLEVLHGRVPVVRALVEAGRYVGGTQDDQLRKAVAHRLLMNGNDVEDAQAFLGRLRRLSRLAMAVSAGAGPEPGGDMRSAGDPGPETVEDIRSESAEDVFGDAEIDDAESDFDEEEFEDTVRPALLKRLEALRGDGEPSGGTIPAAESAVDGDAVSAETATPREAQGRMGKLASHEAILDAASKVEYPPEVAHRESSSSRGPVATSAAHADTGNYWASEHTDDPIDRFWSETPWRAEVDRATAALQMTIRGLRRSAAQTLRLGDPDITERESALTGPARQRAEELRAELVDRVGHRISQSDPGARLGWPVHDDATNLANDLRNSYQELLAQNAFDTEGDGKLGRFREDSAAALAEARDGLDRVAADLEQRWRDRGRDQLGISPEPEHSPAERAVLDDLALAVGRPYHQLDALTTAARADGRPESDGAALQNFADDLAARARDDFGSIRDRFGSPPEQAAETVSEPGEHQQDAPAEESREGRPDSESAETNAEDPHYDSDSDSVPDDGFRSDMTPAKARASLQQLAGNEPPNWHRTPPSLQQRFRTQAELLLGPLVETDQGQPAARERAEAYAQLRDVIARERASGVFWNQTASLRKNLQAWFNHDGVERVSIDLSFAEANERREAAQAGDGLDRARTEFENRWSAELGQGDRHLQELTDPGEQRDPLAGRDLSPRDQQQLRQQVEAALASRSDEVETQAREHAEMLGSLVSALASEMDAARQVAEEPELAGPLSGELLESTGIEPGVAAARLAGIGDRFGSGVVEDLRVRAEGLLTDS